MSGQLDQAGQAAGSLSPCPPSSKHGQLQPQAGDASLGGEAAKAAEGSGQAGRQLPSGAEHFGAGHSEAVFSEATPSKAILPEARTSASCPQTLAGETASAGRSCAPSTPGAGTARPASRRGSPGARPRRSASFQDGLLLALGCTVFCLLLLSFACTLQPDRLPWLVWLAERLPWLLGLACGLMLLLGLGFWWLHARPARILDGELVAWKGEGAGKPRMLRVAARVRALREENDRSRLALLESSENMRETEKLALVGKLAAGVAHSIRNPLTGLKLRLCSLTRGLELDPKRKMHLDAANEAVSHMEKIVSNFLEISRRPRLAKTRCNVSDILDRVLLLLGPRIDGFRISVERTGARLPDIEADGEKLCEALANLVDNACEAAGLDGTVTITEETGRLEPLERALVVRIADSGPGIPEKLREVVFQPFVSTKKEGTGLGLPIARQVFEEHGGWLNLHCPPGRGAVFVCVLPLASKEDAPWLRSSS
ncbi:MAG: HAMP domain-containing histidine kinase [Desulfovibrio sp.]|nr:HAMP domain-containing histidine kinase [Desulfovibrio sp.]